MGAEEPVTKLKHLLCKAGQMGEMEWRQCWTLVHGLLQSIRPHSLGACLSLGYARHDLFDEFFGQKFFLRASVVPALRIESQRALAGWVRSRTFLQASVRSKTNRLERQNSWTRSGHITDARPSSSSTRAETTPTRPFTHPSALTHKAALQRWMRPSEPIIVYATAPGRKALDGGANGHSVYTAALADQMKRSPPVEELFKAVRATAVRQTNGEQVPWETTSLIGTFSFTVDAGVSTPRFLRPQGSAGIAPLERFPSPDSKIDQRLAALQSRADALAEKDIAELRRHAGSGSVDAQVLLGLWFSVDRTRPALSGEGHTWWQAAASRGDNAAQILLANALLKQPQVSPVDQTRARSLLKAATDAGSARAAQALRRLPP